MTEQIANSLTDPTATLTAGIAAGDTSLMVSGWASPLPAAGTFRIRIGSEIILVGSVSGTTLGGLTRGAESTSAAAHALGADVDLVLTAGGLAAYVSENGGSQPGGVYKIDALFTEPAGPSADLVATVPIPVGATVLDIWLYPLAAPWADGFPAGFTVGDGADASRYFNLIDLNSTLSSVYNPDHMDGTNFVSCGQDGNDYLSAPFQNPQDANRISGGVLYPAGATITMTASGLATGGGGGILLVRTWIMAASAPIIAAT